MEILFSKKTQNTNLKFFFFGGWLLLNFLQAWATGLLDDEAYYWVYSRYPAWGYFDHPPMISFFIRVGYFLIRNELGVRLLVIVANVLTLVIIQHLLRQKNDRLFYIICCSIAIIQIGGIIAAPDTPLMLFTALFFLAYKHFLRQMTLRQSLFLGVVTAAMLYSKYHSALVILFTLVSNPKLFTKYQTYLVALIALACYAPHIYWQFQNEFVSIRFQLLDRFANGHDSLSSTLEFLFGQILLAGPFAGIILIWAAFAYRAKDLFDKALKYNLIGFYVFFLLATIRGRVEINWTIVVLIPIMVFSHQWLIENSHLSKWVFRLSLLTLASVMLLRIYLVVNIPGVSDMKSDEVKNNDRWAEAIRKMAGPLPVVFLNSYQNASKYWFYSGQPSFSLNTLGYRRNNFNLWPLEDSLLNHTVFLLGNQDPYFLKDSIITNKGISGVRIIPAFSSFSRINILAPDGIKCVDGQVDQLELSVSVFKPAYHVKDIPVIKQDPLQLWVLANDNIQKIYETGIQLKNPEGGESKYLVSFPLDLPPGKYIGRFSIPSSVIGNPTINSVFTKLDVSYSTAKETVKRSAR